MDLPAASAPTIVTPRATHVAHAWLRAPIYFELQSEAIRRREHIDELTAKLITAVIVLGYADDLVARAQALLEA